MHVTTRADPRLQARGFPAQARTQKGAPSAVRARAYGTGARGVAHPPWADHHDAGEYGMRKCRGCSTCRDSPRPAAPAASALKGSSRIWSPTQGLRIARTASYLVR